MIALLSPIQIEQNRLDCKKWLAQMGKPFSELYPLRQKFGFHKYFYEIEESIDISHNYETHSVVISNIQIED